jgi:hypothetical protein
MPISVRLIQWINAGAIDPVDQANGMIDFVGGG